MIVDHFYFTGINILLAWSVYVILLTGTMSFGNVAFMAVGAYVAGILTVKLAVPFLAALAISALVCMAFGVAVGYPALRTRGLYLIMVTIGLAFCVQVAAENIEYVGGVGGFGGMFGTTLHHVSGALALTGLFLWLLARSPLQRLFDAVREDEHVAGSLGINVAYIRIAAFALGAGLAGLAGGLFGHYMIFIAPDHFGILTSFFIVLYVIFGGMNNMWGPVVGAVLMTLVPEFIRFVADWRTTVFSVLIILMLLFRPEGLLPHRTVTARTAGRLRALLAGARSPGTGK